MSKIFEILHDNLSYLNSAEAFHEFMTVYKFRGGKYKVEAFQGIVNYYYQDEKGKVDNTRCLLACTDEYGQQVNNDEYILLLDKKNILIDKRISKEEFFKLINGNKNDI